MNCGPADRMTIATGPFSATSKPSMVPMPPEVERGRRGPGAHAVQPPPSAAPERQIWRARRIAFEATRALLCGEPGSGSMGVTPGRSRPRARGSRRRRAGAAAARARRRRSPPCRASRARAVTKAGVARPRCAERAVGEVWGTGARDRSRPSTATGLPASDSATSSWRPGTRGSGRPVGRSGCVGRARRWRRWWGSRSRTDSSPPSPAKVTDGGPLAVGVVVLPGCTCPLINSATPLLSSTPTAVWPPAAADTVPMTRSPSSGEHAYPSLGAKRCQQTRLPSPPRGEHPGVTAARVVRDDGAPPSVSSSSNPLPTGAVRLTR